MGTSTTTAEASVVQFREPAQSSVFNDRFGEGHVASLLRGGRLGRRRQGDPSLGLGHLDFVLDQGVDRDFALKNFKRDAEAVASCTRAVQVIPAEVRAHRDGEFLGEVE